MVSMVAMGQRILSTPLQTDPTSLFLPIPYLGLPKTPGSLSPLHYIPVPFVSLASAP